MQPSPPSWPELLTVHGVTLVSPNSLNASPWGRASPPTPALSHWTVVKSLHIRAEMLWAGWGQTDCSHQKLDPPVPSPLLVSP